MVDMLIFKVICRRNRRWGWQTGRLEGHGRRVCVYRGRRRKPVMVECKLRRATGLQGSRVSSSARERCCHGRFPAYLVDFSTFNLLHPVNPAFRGGFRRVVPARDWQRHTYTDNVEVSIPRIHTLIANRISHLADVGDILGSYERSRVGPRRPGHLEHLRRSREVLCERAGRKHILKRHKINGM